MTYLRQSKNKFFSRYVKDSKRPVYGHYVTLHEGVSMDEGDCLMQAFLQNTISHLKTEGMRPVRGTVKMGFWPGKWIGYRLEAVEGGLK